MKKIMNMDMKYIFANLNRISFKFRIKYNIGFVVLYRIKVMICLNMLIVLIIKRD